MAATDQYRLTFGGWYQRTTLHLTEVHGFLSLGFTKLNLSQDKITKFKEDLDIAEVTRETESLEFVKVKTNSDIEIRYFEDGLYILELLTDDIKNGQKILEDYFENKFNPALNYIFSLGAPTPKVLANIKSIHPVVISLTNQQNPQNYKVDEDKYGSIYNKIHAPDISVYKTSEYIFIISTKNKTQIITDLVEMQIFFREFKDQLEKYLNIHRQVWEEISEIKEKKFIKGKDVEKIRTELDRYQKTISLINSRINQMSTYIHTRASLSQSLQINKQLIELFHYRFEVLEDTHAYIKEIWHITSDYLQSAIEILKEVQNRALNNSVISLQIMGSIGVISGIMGYLTVQKLPSITNTGLTYLSILILLIIPINFLIAFIYKNLRYKITFPDHVKNI